jgi:outer membrane autotransporter protein
VLVNGSGVALLAGTSNYQGPTTLAAGTLIVNGSIANSAVSVNAGTLKGNGTVGPLSVNSGTVAPGNSIGTLNVAGNVTFGAGSIYEVEIDPSGHSDLINASGSAAILAGSAVHVLAAPGNYTGTITYRIVEAPAGVSGTFSTLTIDQAGLNAKLVYTTTEVDLQLTEDGPPIVIPPVVIPPVPPPVVVIDLTPDAHTPNEKAVAGAIEAGGPGATIAIDILARAPDHRLVTRALDQLSGEIFPSLRTLAFEEDRLVRITLLHRLRQTTADTPFQSGGDEARTIVPGLSLWVHGFANWATLEGDGNAATLNRRIDGVVGGIDAVPIQDLTLGRAAAYTSNHASERVSIATGERTHVAAYGGWRDGALALRLGGDYGWGTTHVVRTVTFPGFSDTLNARERMHIAQGFGEAAYDHAWGSLALEPFAGVAYVDVGLGAFAETAGAAALTGAANDANQVYSTLGLRLAYDAELEALKITPRALLAGEHAFEALRPEEFLVFEDTGKGFNSLGLPIDRDAANVEFGFDVAIAPGSTFSLYYEGLFADRTRDHTLRANFSWNY